MGNWDEICRVLSEFSEEAHRWIGEQPSITEDSITDWLLRFLSKEISFVHYYRFNRVEEAKNGADWDWWFVDNQSALGLRIQAKRIRENSDHYPGLAHSNRNGFQIDLLLDSSRKDNLIPFYTFFDGHDRNVTKCQTKKHPQAGLSLSSAQMIQNLLFSGGRHRIESSQLLELSNPLACVACCPLTDRGPHPIEGIRVQLAHYFPEAMSGPTSGVHVEPPPYVMSLLQGAREESGDDWERQFRDQLPVSNAVLIFDLREDG